MIPTIVCEQSVTVTGDETSVNNMTKDQRKKKSKQDKVYIYQTTHPYIKPPLHPSINASIHSSIHLSIHTDDDDKDDD
jgi:hypothetical protein